MAKWEHPQLKSDSTRSTKWTNKPNRQQQRQILHDALPTQK